MRLDEPHWWYATGSGDDRMGRLLAPVARLYGAIAMRRIRKATPYRSRLPVVCVGNFTAGGTGKTPFSIAVARILIDLGERPVFLTRGYGGRRREAHWVEAGPGAAARSGDEPLLLAQVAPTLAARDRALGAAMIEAAGDVASIIVMDDGLQNPSVAKDLSIALADGRRGIGNGQVIPAGPLRAPLDFQLGIIDAVAVNRGSEAIREESPGEARFRRVFQGPVLAAHVEPAEDTGWLDGAAVVAYAGIANPERFFDLVARLGARIVSRRTFSDHHVFRDGEARGLLAEARAAEALLVTTEKDLVRLKGAAGAAGELAVASRTLPIRIAFDGANKERLKALIEGALKRVRSG